MVSSSLASDAATAMAGQMAVWAIFYVVLRRRPIYHTKKGTLLDKPELKDVMDAVDGVFCQPFFMILAALALQATYELHDSIETRWTRRTSASYWFQILYVTRQLVHTPIQFITLRDNPTFLIQMTLHHVLSAACYGSGLLTERMHYFAVLDGCCEVTTIFLNALFLCKCFAPADTLALPKAISGGLLWLTFVFFRLLLFPFWLYTFISDCNAQPATTWETINGFERYAYVLVTVFLLVLSAHWFVPITKGMLKAMKAATSKKEKKLE